MAEQDWDTCMMYTKCGLDRRIAEAYANRLRAHIDAVVEFGARIGVPDEQLLVHDATKWTVTEFIPYARYFVEHGGSPVDRPDVNDGFAWAWLHHIHHNKHHWQHWICRTSSKK